MADDRVPVDRFSEGVGRLRETARWTVVVLAAISATLAAGGRRMDRQESHPP